MWIACLSGKERSWIRDHLPAHYHHIIAIIVAVNHRHCATVLYIHNDNAARMVVCGLLFDDEGDICDAKRCYFFLQHDRTSKLRNFSMIRNRVRGEELHRLC